MAALGASKKMLFLCLQVVFWLSCSELALRATGVADNCSARFSNRLICDPILGHKSDPELRPYGIPLNSAGFRSREFTPKADGIYRVLSIGDSCTFGFLGASYVPVPYPQRFERFAGPTKSGKKVEVLNAAVGGYDSYHGVMLLRTKLRGLAPDLITVKFGWNDLFVSLERGSRLPEGRVGLAIDDVLLRVEIYRFARRMGIEFREQLSPLSARVQQKFDDLSVWKPTVPLPDFKRHLRYMVELGREQGAEVMLLTSARNPEPSPLASERILALEKLTIPQLAKIQDSYNQAILEIGSELEAPVVDMVGVHQQYEDETLFVPEDIPHPNQNGHNIEAWALCHDLLRREIISSCDE